MDPYDNVIVTDIDGVCLYWKHGFDMWMISGGFQRVKPSPNSYNMEDEYGITKEKAAILVEEFNESVALKNLPPIKDSIKYIRKLHEEHGYVFHGLTAIRNTQAMYEVRRQNIHNLFGKTAFERITLCDKAENKERQLSEYEGSECFWIEDRPDICEYGLKYGLNCLLFDRPYNRDFRHGQIKRVFNWKEIYEKVTGE